MRRFLVSMLFICAAICSIVISAMLSGQTAPAGNKFVAPQEFPVTMRQNVTAGSTPVGRKVEAKLSIATLVKGIVVPEGAMFIGEVIESTEKSMTSPSLLAIRMDGLEWKEKSIPVKVYLTSWYYPPKIAIHDDQKCDTVEGLRARCPHRHDIPRVDSGGEGTISGISNQSSRMKGIDETRRSDGAVVLTSSQFNIKLEKTTTYVFATDDLKSAR